MTRLFRSHLLGTCHHVAHGHCLSSKFVGFGLNQLDALSHDHHHLLLFCTQLYVVEFHAILFHRLYVPGRSLYASVYDLPLYVTVYPSTPDENVAVFQSSPPDG